MVRKFMKMYKMHSVLHKSFLVRNFLSLGIRKSKVLVIIFRVFILLLSFKNAGGKLIIHMQTFHMLLEEKAQDHLIMKG